MTAFTPAELQEHQDREEAIQAFLFDKAKAFDVTQKNHMPWFWKNAYLNSWELLPSGIIAVNLSCGTQSLESLTVRLPAQLGELSK